MGVRRGIVGGVILAAGGWIVPLHAMADEERATRLERLQVTAGRQGAQGLEVPQAVTVVDEEALKRAEPATWTDAMRGQTGAFVQSSGPGQGIVIVRGLKGSEVLHLVDGFRLNNTFFRNSPSQYIALVDPLMLQQVELLRGPSSVLYGSDAMGGVVQLLTPEYRFSGASWQSRGAVRSHWSSQDLSWVGRAETAVGRDGLSVQAGASHYRFGEYSTAADGRLPDTSYDAQAVDGKLLWNSSATDEWMLSAQWFELPKLARYHQIVPGFSAQAESEYADLRPNNRLFLHGRYRRLAPLAFLHDLELHWGAQDINDDRVGRDAGSSIETREQNLSRLIGITAQARTPIGSGLDWLYGLEFHEDRISAARQDIDDSTGQPSAVRPRFPDGSQQRSIGLYLNQTWVPTARWTVDTGLRFTDARTELPETDRPGVVVHEQDLTGRVGLNYQLQNGWRWIANLGRGFRAPNVFDLGTLGPRPGNRFNVPNPDLGPEVVWSFDTGMKFLQGGCAGELIAFYSRYEDRITSVDTGNVRGDGRTEVQSRNIAEARYYGIESGLDCRFAGTTSMYGAANWTIGKEQIDGAWQPANRVPPLNGRIGVRQGLAAHFTLDAWVDWAARQDRLAASDVDDSRINPNGTGGWATVNLAVQWQASTKMQLSLSGRNLLDQAYREHGSGLDGAGRGISMSVDYRW